MSAYLIGTRSLFSETYQKLLLEYINKLPKDAVLQQGSIDLRNSKHPRLWEYSEVLSNIFMQDGSGSNPPRILDIGGAGSLLGFFLASHGAKVVATDLIDKNVVEAQKTAQKLGISENFTATTKDISKELGPEQYDVVTSVNVIEHVAEHERGRHQPQFKPGLSDYWINNYKMSPQERAAERAFVVGMANATRPGGKLIITFDYKSCGGFKSQMRCAFLRSPEDVLERIVEASGLKLLGKMSLTPNENLDKFEPAASTGIIILRK